MLRRLYSKSLQIQHDNTAKRLKKDDTKLVKQKAEIKALHGQLEKAQSYREKKLFLSIKNHKINFQVILNSNNIEPYVKTVINKQIVNKFQFTLMKNMLFSAAFKTVISATFL